MELTKFECPNCGAKEMTPDDQGRLVCAFCASVFGEAARICPDCGNYNDEAVRFCAQCGEPLVRDCPACGADNWILAEHCVQCGRSLNQVEQITRRWQQTAQEQLRQRKAIISQLKGQEEQASERRMAALMEIERARQQALAEARSRQRRRDAQIYRLVAAAAAILVLLVLCFAVLAVVGR